MNQGPLQFYASANINLPSTSAVTPALPVGSICLIDNKPREVNSFTVEDSSLLKDMADLIARECQSSFQSYRFPLLKISPCSAPRIRNDPTRARSEASEVPRRIPRLRQFHHHLPLQRTFSRFARHDRLSPHSFVFRERNRNSIISSGRRTTSRAHLRQISLHSRPPIIPSSFEPTDRRAGLSDQFHGRRSERKFRFEGGCC